MSEEPHFGWFDSFQGSFPALQPLEGGMTLHIYRYTLASSSQTDVHKTQKSFPPKKKKYLKFFFFYFYGHFKHKNDYTLYTKLKAEKVTSGGISNSCMGKENLIFLRLFWVVTGWAGCWVACGYHKTFWVVVGEELELSTNRDLMFERSRKISKLHSDVCKKYKCDRQL